MNPDNLNRVAMWGTIALLIVAGITFANRWASGNTDESSLTPTVVLSNAIEPSSTANWNTPQTSVSRPEPSPESTTTQPPEPILLDETLATIDAGPPATTSSSTSSTTEPRTTTTLPATVSTTIPPAPEPTATTSSTTTTLPVLTTTTTVPTTTTTTTAPATTTTTTVPAETDIFLTQFSGRPEGDDDDWSVRLDVTLDGTVDGSYQGQVTVSWAGGSGSVVISTGGNGRGRATVGPFSSDSITFSVTGVEAAGWTYTPGLNQVATTLWVFAPSD